MKGQKLVAVAFASIKNGKKRHDNIITIDIQILNLSNKWTVRSDLFFISLRCEPSQSVDNCIMIAYREEVIFSLMTHLSKYIQRLQGHQWCAKDANSATAGRLEPYQIPILMHSVDESSAGLFSRFGTTLQVD